MRRWQLALAIAVAIGLAVWGVGMLSDHVVPTGLGPANAKAPSFAELAKEAGAKGAIAPVGQPEFTATFTASKLSKTTWSTCYPWANQPSGCTNFGNGEAQWFVPGQVQVSGGDLAIVAQRVPTAGLDQSGQPEEYYCRSGMISSYPSFRFEYGYVQVKAWIPNGPGLWPGIWLAAANLKWPPEIDLIEGWGKTATAAFFHPVGATAVDSRTNPPLSQGWHTIGLSWTEAQLTWYVDGKVLLTVHQGIPHQKMYFIADLAEYIYPSTATYCNGQLLIHSIKVWRI